jgi:hypothetical protein
LFYLVSCVFPEIKNFYYYFIEQPAFCNELSKRKLRI